MRAGLAEEGGTVADLERYYRSLSAVMREVEAIRLTALGNQAREALAEQRTAVAGLLDRSEEHTSELQSLMRISYAVFCLKKKKKIKKKTPNVQHTNTNSINVSKHEHNEH